MASGLKRLPVGRFGGMRTPAALPTKQLRTPATFPLPPNPTLPNPVVIPLPSQIQGSSRPPAISGGSAALSSGDRLDFSTQGVGFWRIQNYSHGIGSIDVGDFKVGEAATIDSTGKDVFRIFSPHVHNWQGE